MAAFRKIENKLYEDPVDGNGLIPLTIVRITWERGRSLTSFDSLVTITSCQLVSTSLPSWTEIATMIKLFNLFQLSAVRKEHQWPYGTIGSLTNFWLPKTLRMEWYLISQSIRSCQTKGQTINLYGKYLVGDRWTCIGQGVWRQVCILGRFQRKPCTRTLLDQFKNLKQVTFKVPTNHGQTIRRDHQISRWIEALMDQAVLKGCCKSSIWSNYNPEYDSAVHKLKRAIFRPILTKQATSEPLF